MCAATDVDIGGDDAHLNRRQTALARSKSVTDPRRGNSHPAAHGHGHKDMGTTTKSNGFRSSSNKFGTTARSSILQEMELLENDARLRRNRKFGKSSTCSSP